MLNHLPTPRNNPVQSVRNNVVNDTLPFGANHGRRTRLTKRTTDGRRPVRPGSCSRDRRPKRLEEEGAPTSRSSLHSCDAIPSASDSGRLLSAMIRKSGSRHRGVRHSVSPVPLGRRAGRWPRRTVSIADRTAASPPQATAPAIPDRFSASSRHIRNPDRMRSAADNRARTGRRFPRMGLRFFPGRNACASRDAGKQVGKSGREGCGHAPAVGEAFSARIPSRSSMNLRP